MCSATSKKFPCSLAVRTSQVAGLVQLVKQSTPRKVKLCISFSAFSLVCCIFLRLTIHGRSKMTSSHNQGKRWGDVRDNLVLLSRRQKRLSQSVQGEFPIQLSGQNSILQPPTVTREAEKTTITGHLGPQKGCWYFGSKNKRRTGS